MKLFLIISFLYPTWAAADTVFAKQSIRPNMVITPDDITLRDVDIVGMMNAPSLVVGMEARVAIYAGRPIRANDLRQPALIVRNQIVQIRYEYDGLVITTEGRALDRGAIGERIRIMNLSSRNTVTGTVNKDGGIDVRR